MPKQSAGILLYRKFNDVLQIFLVHPGGPFWKNKDDGAWSIPKGEYESDEDPLAAAKREFYEETGQSIDGEFIALKPIKQKSGKIVQAYLVEGDIDAHNIKSNLFEIEWPPKTSKMQSFPEVDRAGWFTVDEARVKINVGHVGLVEQLMQVVNK
ncbi:NUDIX domain-containing protein [Mucilaginibacter sp. KACC 22773]|uniref:NUDIX domain-containing protein n=1 Tax=Mucilaginibacter sp. KACC 22773 TaxID=3025671 RepID=UPI002365D1B6|nr:NUDIX domain-containing protein [Mucilaginibacter sp. KACC 22773]WDF76215.1 NUDIX domain-containing protein [Mucilaginibacter sp. KACC 22773]